VIKQLQAMAAAVEGGPAAGSTRQQAAPAAHIDATQLGFVILRGGQGRAVQGKTLLQGGDCRTQAASQWTGSDKTKTSTQP
jgi:hypothetical protein